MRQTRQSTWPLRGGYLGVSVLLAMLAGHAAAQDGDPRRFIGLMGASKPDPKIAAGLPRAKLSRAYLPSNVDFSERMPPPVQQELGSCVAHAVGYAARGYYSAIQHGSKPGDPHFTPSPAFIHSQIAGWKPGQQEKTTPEICKQSGSSGLLALLYLSDNGARSNEEVPISDICGADVTGMSVAKNEYSVEDATVIFIQVLDDDHAGDREIDEMKQALAAGKPIVIGMGMVRVLPVSDPDSDKIASLMALDANEVYHGSAGPHIGMLGTGHELAVVGYDDSRQAFRIENSWGKDWADGGFGWIGYDAIKADLEEALVMDAGITPPRPKSDPPKRSGPNVAETGHCSLVTKSPQGTAYDGFVETDAELADLATKLGADQVKNVAVRPWPVCEAMLTLDTPLLSASRPKIALSAGTEQKKFGDVIGFNVTSPDFPSFLYVVYMQADGTVVNLVPRRGPIRKQVPPNTTVTFGDGKEGRQTFRASAPAGAEAVVAIASRSPLLQLEDLEKDGNGQFRLSAGSNTDKSGNAQDRLYLSLLRSALVDMPDTKAAKREVTADVLPLTISTN